MIKRILLVLFFMMCIWSGSVCARSDISYEIDELKHTDWIGVIIIAKMASDVYVNTSSFGVNISTSADTSQKAFDELNVVVVSSATYSQISSTATYSLTSGTATYSNDSDKLDGFHYDAFLSTITDTMSGTLTVSTVTFPSTLEFITPQGKKIIFTENDFLGAGYIPEIAFESIVNLGTMKNGLYLRGTGANAVLQLMDADNSNRAQIMFSTATADLSITTDGGDIDFGDENLTTSGLIQGTTIYATSQFKCPDGTVFTSTSTFGGGGASTFLELTDTPGSFDSGKYFKSWASSGTWETVSGDNLGNHTATQDIDASGYNLSITTITFSDFTILTSTSGLGGGGWDGTTDLSITNGVKLKDGYLRIGDAGGVTHTTGDGDLYVERYLEVDSIIYTGQLIATNQMKLIADNQKISVGYHEDFELKYVSSGKHYTSIGVYCGSTSRSGNIIIHNKLAVGAWGHAIEANPVLRIQSSDNSSVNDYISFGHDQTDANIKVGAGDLILTIAGNDLLPSTTNHNLGSSSNYWGTLHIATITYHSIPDYQADLSIGEDILKIKPSDKSSYPSFLYREPVDTIRIKAIEKDKIPKDKEKIKYKKIKDLPVECIVKKYDVEIDTFTEVTMLLEDVMDEEIIEILPQKSEVEVTYVGNEGVSLEAIISLLIEHNKELEQRVRELENR